ncbi:MAG: DUF1684 domain-containing protein [Candidatus Cyclobacteriaceae bacterium M2_1C_046]
MSFIILIYSFSGGETEAEYKERITKEREDKEQFMRSSRESPFKNREYKGLKYFEPDPAYKVMARFDPVEVEEIMLLPTSDNKQMRYRKYGYAEFELHDENNRLLILELADGSEDEGNLFIPFGDATSADQTYGAGRYLDIKHNPKEVVVLLDFNNAYNPYCAYNEEFSCPLPPKENLLIVPIQAGEKNYE